MADNQTTTVVRADLRNVEEVLAATGKLLDLTKPAGLLFLACLHNIRPRPPGLQRGSGLGFLRRCPGGTFGVIIPAGFQPLPGGLHQDHRTHPATPPASRLPVTNEASAVSNCGPPAATRSA
jgi:hypothetical protein